MSLGTRLAEKERLGPKRQTHFTLHLFTAKRGSVQAKQFEDDYNDDNDTDDVKDIVAHAPVSNHISYLRVSISLLARVMESARAG
jgi:hypothetical protein